MILRAIYWNGSNRPGPYCEPEINEILAAFHEDVATLRREMIDYGMLARQGGGYRRRVMLWLRSPESHCPYEANYRQRGPVV